MSHCYYFFLGTFLSFTLFASYCRPSHCPGKEDKCYKRSVLNFTRAAFRWNESDVAITRFLADEKGRNLFISYMQETVGEEGAENDETANLLKDLADLNTNNFEDEKFLKIIKPLMEMKAFETFLNSSHFNGWLASNQGLFNSMHADKIYESMENEGVDKTMSMRTEAQAAAQKAVTESLALAALRLVDDKECAVFVSNSASWLSSMLAAAEFIPLPFTIATANPAAGFPLIYVNPAFEKLTGYKKEEIVGRNCNFLQTDNTTGLRYYSTTSVETGRMSMKLRGGLPVTSRLKNFKKDGTPFYNRLVMHPLFDQVCTYLYMLIYTQ